MKHFFSLLIISFAITFASCSKDDDDKKASPALTKMEMISGTDWVVTEMTSRRSNSTIVTDDFAAMDACKKDDIFTFAADSTLTIDENTNNCRPGSDQIKVTRKWAFTQNETKVREIFSSKPGDYFEFEIISLTSTKMVLGSVLPDPSGAKFGTCTYVAY